MGEFAVRMPRRADGSLAIDEAPNVHDVIIRRSYTHGDDRLEYVSEPINTFPRRHWIGLMPEFGMCDLTWPG
jgi:hypothetical protein